MKKIIFFLCFLACYFQNLAQAPVNDSISNAIDIGPLNSAGNCPISGYGTDLSIVGSTMNASYEVMQPMLVDCQNINGNHLNPLVPDVWYKFEASAEFLHVKLEPNGTGPFINNPTLALYEYRGNFLKPIPINCARGLNDTVSVYSPNLVPGKFYLIQVGGTTNTDLGNFRLTFKNRLLCSDCVQHSEIKLVPEPVMGYYEPGQKVRVHFRVMGFKNYMNDKFKAITFNFGNGWDTTGITASAINPQAINSNGMWKAGTVVFNTISNFGFKYNPSTPPVTAGDGPSNEFTQWVFSFEVRVKPCTGTTPQNLNMRINTISENEYLVTASPCKFDKDITFYASANCCSSTFTNVPQPVYSNLPCFANCNGTITITPNSSAPVGFATLSNSNGSIYHDNMNIFLSDNGQFNTACPGWVDIILAAPSNTCTYLHQDSLAGADITNFDLIQNQFSCVPNCFNSASVVNINMPTGNTVQANWYSASNPGNAFASGLNVNNLCPAENYTVTMQVLNAIGQPICSQISSSIFINGMAQSNPNVEYSSSVCEFGPDDIPYVSSPGGSFFQVQPSFPNAIDTTNGTLLASLTSPGVYEIHYISPGPCTDTSINYVNVISIFNSSFDYANSSFCKSDPDYIPNVLGDLGGSFSFYPGGLVLDTVSGKITPSLSDTGMYIVYYQVGNGTLCFSSSVDTIYIDDACATEQIYNAFSPNGDGLNDLWIIDGIDETKNTVWVFNRWGNLVFREENYNNRDVVFDGHDRFGFWLNEGTYYYIIEQKGERKKGWLELTK